MPACSSLPDSACPYKASGSEVSFEFPELDLCKCCELTRRQVNGAPVPGSLIKETLSFRNKFKNISNDTLDVCNESSLTIEGNLNTSVKQSVDQIMGQEQEVNHSLSIQSADI